MENQETKEEENARIWREIKEVVKSCDDMKFEVKGRDRMIPTDYSLKRIREEKLNFYEVIEEVLRLHDQQWIDEDE